MGQKRPKQDGADDNRHVQCPARRVTMRQVAKIRAHPDPIEFFSRLSARMKEKHLRPPIQLVPIDGINALRRKASIPNRDSKCKGIIKVCDTGRFSPLPLQFNLPAKFNHPAGRNSEEFPHGQSIAMQEFEHLHFEAPPSRMAARRDAQSADEERCVHHVEMQRTFALFIIQGDGDVRLLHETIADAQRMKV
ncbi:MAG: hypothetical protein P4M13_03535, partial [Alphaproteobacteria bacterium]|nr:hypothetical protein [Alphaproteobacteria bacterium]